MRCPNLQQLSNASGVALTFEKLFKNKKSWGAFCLVLTYDKRTPKLQLEILISPTKRKLYYIDWSQIVCS